MPRKKKVEEVCEVLPVENCKFAWQLLADPARWTQNAMAKNAMGFPSLIKPEDGAVCWCMTGAIYKIYSSAGRTRSELFLEFWRRVPYLNMTSWNDDPGRKHSEVVAMMKEVEEAVNAKV